MTFPGDNRLGSDANDAHDIEEIPAEENLTAESSALTGEEDARIDALYDSESRPATIDYLNSEDKPQPSPRDLDAGSVTADEEWSVGIEDEENQALFDVNEPDSPSALPEMGTIDLVETPSDQQLDPSSSDRYITED